MATTIQIKEDTREKLKRFGYKGESYDNIIDRLISYFEELNVENLIEKRYKKLLEEKEQYVSLDEI
ncbi:MAG: BfmA/BtgA family mobilization protein [Thermoplasmatota archaeon]